MDKHTERDLHALEQSLRQLVDDHEQLLALLQRKRECLRQGNDQAMLQAATQENEKLRAISEHEKQRAQLAGNLTLRIDPDAKAPMRLGELAEHLPEPARGRILALRHQWHQRMEETRRQAAVLQQATEALVRHMQGVMQTIGANSTGVSTYGQKGAPPSQATAVRTINMTA